LTRGKLTTIFILKTKLLLYKLFVAFLLLN
jgi:hypothetical protein